MQFHEIDLFDLTSFLRPGKKNLVKSNKSISRKKNILTKYFFAMSKMTKNQFLNWGKSLKMPEMQFHEKMIYLISRVFLPGLF